MRLGGPVFIMHRSGHPHLRGCTTVSHSPNKQTKVYTRSHAYTEATLPDDDEVLTFAEWIALNKISARNGRRILKSQNGPIVTMLSERRIGITRGNNRRWQKSRERAA
jgi:hypothetical protein